MKWLKWTWHDVYYAGLRKGYDRSLCLYLAERWEVRRRRERARSYAARGAAQRGKKKNRTTAPAGWLTVRDAAAIVGISYQAINQRVRRGTLPDLLPETVERFAKQRKEARRHV